MNFWADAFDPRDATDVLFCKRTPGRWLSDQRQHTVRAPAETRPQRLTFCTLQQLHSEQGGVFVYDSDYCRVCGYGFKESDGETAREEGSVNTAWGLRFQCFRLVDLQYSGPDRRACALLISDLSTHNHTHLVWETNRSCHVKSLSYIRALPARKSASHSVFPWKYWWMVCTCIFRYVSVCVVGGVVTDALKQTRVVGETQSEKNDYQTGHMLSADMQL